MNGFRITLSNILTGSKTTHWEAICEKTSETVDGVTITATYDIPSYSAVTQLKTQIDSLNSNLSTPDGKLKIYSGVLYLNGGASGNVYHYYKENGVEWYITPICMIECVDENSSYNVAITNGTKMYHTIKNNETVTLGIRWTVIGLIKE